MAQDDMKNFIASLNNTEDFVTFNETDRGEVNDWIPTMIPLMDKYLVGGIPISGQISEIFGGPSSGKALDNNTLIPTPEGNKKLSDIKVGDFIFDRLGKPTKVLGVFPQGEKEVYEVKLLDGRSIKVNDEHIWSVMTKHSKLKEKTTREMINGGIKKASKNTPGKYHYHYQLPMNKWVVFKEHKVNVDPYVEGILLSAMQGSAPISDAYLFNSREVRLKLAQGILDAGKVSLSTTDEGSWLSWEAPNEAFQKQVASLFRSLGYWVDSELPSFLNIEGTIAKLKELCTFKQDRVERNYNLVYDSTPSETLNTNHVKTDSLLRNNDTLEKTTNNIESYDRVSIVSIKDLGYKEEMTCLYVDNPEHLFLAGDYIVTHNSTFSGLIMKNGLAMGVIPVYYDVEGTQNASRLEQLGVDTSRVLTKTPKKLKDGTVRPLSVESIGQNMIETAALIHNSKPEYLTLFIWDSIADTQSDMEADADMDQSLVGQQARALAKVGRKTKANFVENNAALLAFNQARADIGATNPRYAKTKTTGGNSWYHFLDTRILLSKGGKSSQVTKSSSDDEVIGYKTRVNIEKSKLGDNADAKFEVVLLTDTGFDTDYNIIVTGQELGLISSGRSPKYEADNKEVITGRNVYDLYLKFQDPKNMEIKREIWQKECLYFFPECYPAIFNTTAVMHEKAFPLIKGLRKKYADIQEKLPVEKQAYNYKRFKSTKLPLDV